MAKKAKDELFTCVICGEEVRRDKSSQYGEGRACKKHQEVQEARQQPIQQVPLPSVAVPKSPASSLRRRGISQAEIVEALRGKSNGTKVRITFEPNGDAFEAVGYLLLMMKGKIIRMDDRTFANLYVVGVSGRWDRISRTCDVTVHFKSESDLEDWFAARLDRGVEKLEVV